MKLRVARVQDIILDENHPKYNSLGKEESIGTVFFTYLDEFTPINNNLNNSKSAKPLHYSISYYPVPNELIHVLGAPSSTYNETSAYDWYYMPPISVFKDPTSNALPNVLDDNNLFYEGHYFKAKENIRPLRPYEGDIMFEGRFGQSIRFGSTIDNSKTPNPNSWSNEGILGDPITIIRNGQVESNPNQEKASQHIIENINGDDSSIYLCSNQQINNFYPISLHDESYLNDIFKPKTQEEAIFSNEDLDPDTQEDIQSSKPNTIPPEELQKSQEISENTDTDTANYDISPTEQQILLADDIDNDIPPNIIVPDNINSNDLISDLPLPNNNT